MRRIGLAVVLTSLLTLLAPQAGDRRQGARSKAGAAEGSEPGVGSWPMRTASWFLVSLVLLISGCATTRPPDAPTVDVTGTWGGVWLCQQCASPQGVSAITMRLDQVGATVTGTISWGALRSVSRVDGSVARDVLRFRAPDIDLTGELSVKGNDMDGRGRSAGLSISMSLHRY